MRPAQVAQCQIVSTMHSENRQDSGMNQQDQALCRTWRVNDGQVGAVFIFNLHNNLLRPELALSFKSGVLKLDV